MTSLKIDRTTINRSEEASMLLPLIQEELIDLSLFYPGFQKWYESKVIPGLYSGERTLLLEMRNNHLAGIAILKNDGDEKKLCCLRIMDEFQNKGGIGLKLFERSMQELETRYPLLSVGEEKLDHFIKIFHHFGFKKSWEYPEYYRPRKTEISFNGILLPQRKVNTYSRPSFTKVITDKSFKMLTA